MNQKHGMKDTRFYEIWKNMKKRCFNENRSDFKRYGGRGITVCDRWIQFINFKIDMYSSYLDHAKKHGESDTTLDRIDNDGDYKPSNCRWATKEEQSANRRSNAIQYEIDGRSLTLKEIAGIYNVNFHTLRGRINKGLNIHDAVKIPNKGRGGDRWNDNFNNLRGE